MDQTVAQLVELTRSVAFDAMPEAAVVAARQRIVDTVGCAIGGYSGPPAVAVRAVAYPTADDNGSRIWVSGLRVTPEDAALANGVAARYLDYNDAYRGTVDVGHPADNIPALIALGEDAGATLAQVIEAVALAYQVQLGMAESVPLNDRGWDQPTAVVIAAAVGASRLLGLDEEQTAHAISLAIVPNMAMHQTRCGELSFWKGCAAPMGARQGIFAARMAAAGMEGPHDPFDGLNGFWAQFGSRHELPPLAPADGQWAIQQSNIKKWPVRDSCQIGVDAAIELREQGVDPATVSSVSVETYKSSYRWAVQDRELWAPQTRETADHSLPFSIAVTMLDGSVSPATFENERFKDKDVLDLIGMTEIVVSDDFSAQTPGIKNCRVTVRTQSGDTRVAHVILTQEEIERGRSDDEVNAKFVALAEPVTGAGRAAELVQQLWSADPQAPVAELVDLLTVES